MTDELTIVQPDTLAATIKAETESAVDIAKRYPRDIKQIKKRVLAYATADQETAAACFYAKPVGGKTVEGPGIRLAEIIVATYQNIRFGSRVTGIEDKWVTVQGVCYDVENNSSFTAEIKRSIWSKDKGRYTQNNIETNLKAAGSISVRDAVFKVIPLSMFYSELNEIKKVATGAKPVNEKEKPKPLTERFNAAIEYYNRLGISKERVFAAAGLVAIEDLNESHLAVLIGLRTSLKEESVTLDEAFPSTKKEESDNKANKAIDNVLAGKKK